MSVDLRLGDCRVVMAETAANSVDAIVTDPPYGLEFMGKEWDRLDDDLPQAAQWKGRRGKGGGGVNTPDPNWKKFENTPRVSYGGKRHAFRRCAVCGKRQFSGSPCECEAPEWVVEYPEGAPSGMVRQQRWHESWAREAYRVLKPGGHLLAFGGTRTFHRLACALEDAGFEIRDVLSWLYGSGFPKSLDVSKALDKQRDDRADVLLVTAFVAGARDRAGLANRDIDDAFDMNGMAGHWTSGKTQPSVPTWEQWLRLKDLLGCGDEMDNEVWRLNGRKGQPGEAWHEREVVGASRGKTKIGGADGATPWSVGAKQATVAVPITAPATDLAAQWAGWGTALKPAWEPIILARKPLSGTVAANVAAHGTGALNIDATRILGAERPLRVSEDHGLRRGTYEGGAANAGGSRCDGTTTLGRWPANVVLGCCGHDPHDPDCVVRLLDEQSGESRSRVGKPRQSAQPGNGYGMTHTGAEYNDTSGASRFFLNVPADSSIAQDLIPNNEADIIDAWERQGQSHNDRMDATSRARDTCAETSADGFGCSTSSSGNSITDPSQPDGKSITATATNKTTASKTSNSLTPRRTSDCTADANSETAFGGNPADSAENSSPSPPNTGISTGAAIRSTDDAELATLAASLPINSADALRFAYIPKASRSERNSGLGGPDGVHANMHPT